MLYELVAVFAGGGIGAVLRYLMTLCAGKCFGMPYVEPLLLISPDALR